MNATNMGDNELTSTLARQAERFTATHGGDLSMDQVMARAGEIRRGRRMRASMVMAAVFLAAAVPVGITVLNPDSDSNKPSPAAPPNTDALGLEDLKVGTDPRTGWVANRTLRDEGVSVRLDENVQATYLARLDGGFLVGGYDEQAQEMTATYYADDGSGGMSWPTASGFAVSGDGRTGAFVQPDGTVIAVEADGGYVDLGTVPGNAGSGYDALAISGDCFSSCTAIVASTDQDPTVWSVDKAGSVTELNTGLQAVSDTFGTAYAGTTRFNEDDLSTCSALVDNGVERWTTCPDGKASGPRLSAFSPDGKHVLGTQSIGDGEGDNELVLFDAASGKQILSLDVAGLGTEQQGVIRQMMWEDDTHVLALVRQGAEFAVIRVDLKGEREYALAPMKGVDYDTAPFTLPVG
jgi:hypothetical protein